ncbi:MAG: hydrogenase maturation nickel metallochaperone HypA/HybF [Candidatus Hodarchaeales archaeon]
MHEFSLAQSVCETIITIAKKNGASTIKRVKLKFGSFALIQEDQFQFCFDIIKKESNITKNTTLEIEWVPGKLKCLSCNFVGEVKDVPQEHNELAPIFQCPSCKKYTTEIISGSETVIDSIIV